MWQMRKHFDISLPIERKNRCCDIFPYIYSVYVCIFVATLVDDKRWHFDNHQDTIACGKLKMKLTLYSYFIASPPTHLTLTHTHIAYDISTLSYAFPTDVVCPLQPDAKIRHSKLNSVCMRACVCLNAFHFVKFVNICQIEIVIWSFPQQILTYGGLTKSVLLIEMLQWTLLHTCICGNT